MGRQVLVDLDDLQARSLAESSKPLIPSMAAPKPKKRACERLSTLGRCQFSRRGVES
jgi:hypothetical protein